MKSNNPPSFKRDVVLLALAISIMVSMMTLAIVVLNDPEWIPDLIDKVKGGLVD